MQRRHGAAGRIRRFTALTAVAALVLAVHPAPATAAKPAPTPRSQFAAAGAGVTADFAADSGPGHAEVFGSSINVPALLDTNKIETLHQSGTRFIRGDAYLFRLLPNTTIPNYLAAMQTNTGVADPNTWNWSDLAWVDEHHNRGEKIILILSYLTSWMGYDCGCAFNYQVPPRGADGFRVYEDVVKKLYQRLRGKIDLVEVWNEPDLSYFLNLTNSPYPNNAAGQLAAYKDIYYHASRAIRSVDATIPIGGPSTAIPDHATTWVPSMFADQRISQNINFLTYHTYNDYGSSRSEHVTAWKNAAAAAGKGNDFPVYVTEWNYSATYSEVPMNANHAHSISYAANRLSNFYKQRANGTNFFADNDEAIEPNFFGVHRNGLLPPKARVYRLMSRDLGLGAGTSRQHPVTFPGSVSNAGAATTANGERVAWVVNDGAAPVEVDLNLTGLPSGSTRASIFEASPIQTTVTPKASVPLTVSGGAATVRFAAPAKSVVGVRLTPYAIADTEDLAAAATVTPSSVSTADPDLTGARIVDDVIGVHATGEWASNQELTPNVRLDWSSPQTVGQIVLYDRANPVDRIASGRLEFSDGSTVPVPALPNDGAGKAISFAPRSVSWVRFVVTSGAGANVGLSELQVHAGANVVQKATVTASTQANLGSQSRLNAVDGVLGTAGEWASTETDPWIQARWVNSQTVDRVVLFDRPGASNANGGTLTFSDGTSVPVTGIPADGSAKVVSFPAKPVTWVRFQVAGGAGANVGLSELRVLRAGNLASSAVATASSSAAANLGPTAATDEVVNQWYEGEWASNRQLNPRLRLTWATPQTVGQVVLHDRINLVDHAPGGTLLFSDGTSVPVAGMANVGTAKVIAFQPRSVSWVEFVVAGGVGLNVGLAEIEAYAANGIQRIESNDQPASFWRHQNGLGRIDPFSGLLDDFRFRVVAGLADPTAVSFESVNFPGHYLRHHDSRIKLHPADGSALFNQDATFRQVPGLASQTGWVSYRSHNYPANYISHDASGALSIAPPTGTGAAATFRAVS